MKPAKTLITFLLLIMAAPAFAVMLSGETLNITRPVDDDLYAAGGSINSMSGVSGDLVIAGGRLNLDGEVVGDVMAAGGDILLRARVGDDVRIAGGDVIVQGLIRDDLIAAAGSLRIANTVRVGGESRLAGGEVIVDGRHRGPLQVRAGRVLLLGQVDGDVEIWAEQIELGASARVGGKLSTRGPNPVLMQDGASVAGSISHQDVDLPTGSVIAGLLTALLVTYLMLVLAAILLYLLFPGVAGNAAGIMASRFWASMGIGLAVFAAVPLVIMLCLSTGIAAVAGLILLLIYLLLLITGYLNGAHGFATWLRRRFNSQSPGRLAGSLWLALSLLILGLIGLVPLLGFLVGFAVLLLGMGSLSILLKAAYSGNQQEPAGGAQGD